MAPRRNPTPTYRLHKRSGKGILDVYRHDGRRTSLVMPGTYGSPESLAENARILALLATNDGRLPPTARELKADGILIDELVLRFLNEKVAVDYVNSDGMPTSEQGCFKQSLLPLSRLYGSTLVSAFDSAALARVQAAMITGSWRNAEEREAMAKRHRPIGRGRTTVNKGISRIRMMFKWGKIRKLVSAELITDLECVPFLKPGEGGAREYDPVEPVAPEIVELTLPDLPPTVGDIIRVLQLTGARCGEILSMRMADLDRSGPIWFFRPRKHKTKKSGGKRVINFGPKSQLILSPYLKPKADAYIFSPEEQGARISAKKRSKRKTKIQPSQVDRSRPNATRKPGKFFKVSGIGHASKPRLSTMLSCALVNGWAFNIGPHINSATSSRKRSRASIPSKRRGFHWATRARQ